ncbi:uncharacterized protein [Blastocystis hominis]|uniref:Uncharacterized protein n=1 Tax=Blastocystis hominis TaxID=12968 RepID=D8M441_BLAHO|nr:uncharacterized protein [Blastocystis hominis]CBK22830.2 unnamed protein product [Blastocystis hominis]|eukprot:XP_012896878.1 uncharacterized protein [Blastocystis hominis]
MKVETEKPVGREERNGRSGWIRGNRRRGDWRGGKQRRQWWKRGKGGTGREGAARYEGSRPLEGSERRRYDEMIGRVQAEKNVVEEDCREKGKRGTGEIVDQ